MHHDQHHTNTLWRHGSIISLLQDFMAAHINHPHDVCLLRLVGLLIGSH